MFSRCAAVIVDKRLHLRTVGVCSGPGKRDMSFGGGPGPPVRAGAFERSSRVAA
ncbi:Uncharacterised protein [Mycobacteroides abscessus subsp. abscessus]|nr:Uncharacterised protein [Mycobacteroides abscessus subsp. abscessus]